MKEQKLDISDYGLYLLSPNKLVSFLKENKIRSKKILQYFQTKHDKYLNALEQGVCLTILPIDSIEYVIKLSPDTFDKSWEETMKYEGFNLEIGSDNNLWIGSLSNLHNWQRAKYSVDKDFNSYTTLDDEVLYNSFGFHKEEGKYLVNIFGYKRKKKLDYPEANYGFLFEFEKVQEFKDYKDPREEDKYFFNVAQT